MIATGLLGGSFNPAHGGHRSISLLAMDALGLDALWWLVSPGNPLKSADDMAPLRARLASAQAMARGTRIRATAIESRLGTRYTVDTVRSLVRRYPNRRFIWLMGADNLAQFHRWRDWRRIATLMPIAVIARPGYDRHARASPAMGWLRPHVHPSGRRRCWMHWGAKEGSVPGVVFLRFPPDPRSATRLRAANPGWARSTVPPLLRDPVTRQILPEDPA